MRFAFALCCPMPENEPAVQSTQQSCIFLLSVMVGLPQPAGHHQPRAPNPWSWGLTRGAASCCGRTAHLLLSPAVAAASPGPHPVLAVRLFLPFQPVTVPQPPT